MMDNTEPIVFALITLAIILGVVARRLGRIATALERRDQENEVRRIAKAMERREASE
ncbi:MAG: hypothetical protein WD151_11315 [Phycisphaeraceae bacterium]